MRGVGWIPVNQDGSPFRSVVGRSHWQRTQPLRVYRTKGRAEAQSPGGLATEVFVGG